MAFICCFICFPVCFQSHTELNPQLTLHPPPQTASKHALLGLTKSDAIMYAAPPHNIRINAICPGYIGTPLLKGALTAGSVMEAEVAKVPQGRLGEMEEVADAVVFLASGMSSFVVGAGMVVDGGYTAG